MSVGCNGFFHNNNIMTLIRQYKDTETVHKVSKVSYEIHKKYMYKILKPHQENDQQIKVSTLEHKVNVRIKAMKKVLLIDTKRITISAKIFCGFYFCLYTSICY